MSSTTPAAGSPISRFYAGKSILVTGATGFIGKVLIEKLLHSCPDIHKIYLLIRSAKGHDAQQRLQDMVRERPFNIRLKAELIADKLVAIESDLAQPRLGLSAASCSLLAEQVSLVFHVAASVKFEAPLEVNMLHNVVATKELLELASHFKRLLCFVHVSTAYSNCQLRQIDERIYPMPVPDDPMSLQVTKAMIDNRPNTYTYTKAMAENVATKYAALMNVVIVRPSIVMSAIKEPTQGWVDTINGPVGLSVLGALGILQKIKVNSEVVFDLIPVDIVTNALVSIAWAATMKKLDFLPGSSPSLASASAQPAGEPNNNNNNLVAGNAASQHLVAATNGFVKPSIARCIEKFEANSGQAACSNINATGSATTSNHNNNNNNNHLTSAAPPLGALANGAKQVQELNARNLDGTVRVFNLTTGDENPCSFYKYFSVGRDEAYIKPSARALRPLLTIPRQKGMNSIKYWIHKIFSHLLFAYLVDALLALMGRKKMVIKAVDRMHRANDIFDFFCSNQWNFITDNVKKLLELQAAEDRVTFNCDVRAIDWDVYARIAWLGCRRFILREPDETIGYAKRRYRAICLLYYFVKLMLVLAVTGLVTHQLGLHLLTSYLILAPTYAIVYLM